HSSEFWALATHPLQSIIATGGGSDNSIRLWSISSRKVLLSTNIGNDSAFCLGFDPSGKIVAAGLESGDVLLLDSSTLEQVKRINVQKVKIDDLKFSPNGEFLAVGSHANVIDIFDVSKDYERIGTCKGHSSFVSHLDWSKDSLVIQTD